MMWFNQSTGSPNLDSNRTPFAMSLSTWISVTVLLLLTTTVKCGHYDTVAREDEVEVTSQDLRNIRQLPKGRLCSHDLGVAKREPLTSDPQAPVISVNGNSFYPGKPLNVTIKTEFEIAAFILHARYYGADTITGIFDSSPPGGHYVLLNCDGPGDTLLALYDTRRGQPGVKDDPPIARWMTPETLASPVVFVATVVGINGEVWENVTSKRLSKGFSEIDFSTCASEKGCFRYYKGGQPCTANQCEYAVTYKEKEGIAEFEMTAKAAWMAIGFSSDKSMGGDDVLLCIKQYNDVEIHQYFTEYSHISPRRIHSSKITHKEVQSNPGGRISCRFRRPMKVADDSVSVDLNNVWYQLYAWGGVTTGGSLQRHNLPSPPISEFKIALSKSYNKISASSNTKNTVSLIAVSNILLILFYHI